MKIASRNSAKLFIVAPLACAALLTAPVSGAILLPQAVSSGFNEDIIANGNQTALASTTTPFDNIRVMYSEGWQGATQWGLPSSGAITSAASDNEYQLADYSGNNALVMKGSGSSGTLELANPGAFTQIGILATSSQGGSSLSYTLNFVDGGEQTGSFSVNDWFNGTDPIAIQGFGRVVRTNDSEISGTATNPRIYEYIINIDAALQNESLVSLSFENTLAGHAGVFAVSAIPEPSTYAAFFGLLAALFILRRRRA